MARNLFVYGSLQFDEIVRALTGNTYTAVPATLQDYEVQAISDRPYPALVPSTGKVAKGYVLLSVEERDVEIIDNWEDKEYTQEIVTANSSFGQLESTAYVWSKPDMLDGLWLAAEFKMYHLKDYVENKIPAHLASGSKFSYQA